MSNFLDMRCPHCGNEDRLDIEASIWVGLAPMAPIPVVAGGMTIRRTVARCAARATAGAPSRNSSGREVCNERTQTFTVTFSEIRFYSMQTSATSLEDACVTFGRFGGTPSLS